ncbi:MAG: lysophospholipase [Candidatus Hodarchaeales archaeon]
MNHSESNFTTKDGLSIYYQKWIPNENPKAIVQIIHGLAEHSSRYLNVVNALLPNNFAVYAGDLRGHGKSEGLRGFINSFDDFVSDSRTLTQLIKKEFPDTPIFLLAHSMGSFIAIHYASVSHDFNGLILSGSGLRSGDKISFFLVLMLKLFSKIRPKGRVHTGLSDAISHDPEVVEAYKKDPLVLDFITFRLGKELLDATKRLPDLIAKLDLPILMQSGSQDSLVSGVSDLFEYVQSKDKTLKIYEGLYHEVYNELKSDREKVLSDLLDWLNTHL